MIGLKMWIETLKKLKITLTYEEIALMTNISLKKLVKETTERNDLEFLKHHIKSKGKEGTMMTEVKNNFKNKYDNFNCDNCEKKNQYIEEHQEHVYN